MQSIKSLSSIGRGIREYLWLLERADSPDVNGLCLVNRGEPVPQDRIAADLGKTRSSVIKNLRQLERNCLVLREIRPGRPNSFKIKIHW